MICAIINSTRGKEVKDYDDKRRHYILVVDTETANTLTETDENGKAAMDMSCVLVYDCGWAVVDTKGNIYETASL